MDLREHNKYASRAVHQFMPPKNFELAGESFKLLMDDGYDCVLNFIDGETLEWGRVGGELFRENYLCLKGDDTTYLVSFEAAETTLRTSHLYIIDKDNSLVTRQIATVGKNPRWPYLVDTEHEFGAIEQPGKEYTSYPRHGYTSDLIGNTIQWAYSVDMVTVHIYYCADFYRITYPFIAEGASTEGNAGRATNAISAMLNSLPSRDEPTDYIKIKEGMYLVSLTEQNAEKLLTGQIMFRSNNLTFLQNYKRVYQVARAFGTSTTPDGDTRTHLGIGAYGKLLDSSDERIQKLMTDPNPFLI